ncbi:hypothetical protein B0H13DRAFT_1869891 [Mycena leptocephala]|nr:hypothetical protein B0H13DRAFT_1869891 [Mycena leptocephala]
MNFNTWSRMDRGINGGIRHRKLKGQLVGHVPITRFRAGDSRHRGWVRRTEICVDGTRVGRSFLVKMYASTSRDMIGAHSLLIETLQGIPPVGNPQKKDAVAELLPIAAGDVKERYIKLRSGWGEGGSGITGEHDGGAGAKHQGVPTQQLRMHLVLRVVHSGCRAGVRFERRGRFAQDTVACAWERDGVKDATLQSDNRVGSMVGNDVFLLLEAGRTVKDDEVDVEEVERKEGSGRETHQNRAISMNPDPSQKGEISGPAIDTSMLWPGRLDSNANRPHQKNLNVESQRERDRGEGQAGAQRSASTRRGKDLQRVRCKRREYLGVTRVPTKLEGEDPQSRLST